MSKVEVKQGIIIARVSTEEQAKERHYSIPVQVLATKKYAEKKGIDVPDDMIFELKGESAFKGRRKKFKEAIQKATTIREETSEPVALIFYEADRLTRRVVSDVMLKIKNEIDAGKFVLMFAKDDRRLDKFSSAQDWLIFNIENAVFESASKRQSEKVKDTFRYKVERGERPGYLPLGYLKGGAHDPERAPLIKEIFDLYATGSFSIEELTTKMRNRGLTMRPKNGNEPRLIANSDVNYILNNSSYTSCYAWPNSENGSREVRKFNYEPIITEELFDRVQKVLSEKAIKYSTRHSTCKFFEFRGLVICEFCGCVLTPNDLSTNYKNKKPGEEVYYRCTNSKKHIDPEWYLKKFGTKNCPQRHWREEEIGERIKEQFSLIKFSRKERQEIRKQLNEKFQTGVQLGRAEKHRLEEKLSDKEELKSRMIRQLDDDRNDDFKLDIREEIKRVKQEIASVKEELEKWEEVEDIKTDEFIDALVLCSDLEQMYEKLSPMNRRNLVILVFKSIRARKKVVNVAGRTIKGAGLFFEWSESMNGVLRFKEMADRGFEKWLAEEGYKIGKEASEGLQRHLGAQKAKKPDLNKIKVMRERLSGRCDERSEEAIS